MKKGERVVLMSKIAGRERIAVGRVGTIVQVYADFETDSPQGYTIEWDRTPTAEAETTAFVGRGRVLANDTGGLATRLAAEMESAK